MDGERLDFQALAETIPILCWIANPDGFIVWYNHRWYDYTGTTPAQMEGWGWQDVHDATQLPRVLERWRESIATGAPFEMIFPLRGADRTFRPFLTRVVPSRGLQNEITAWYGVNIDISEQTIAERELRERRLVEGHLIRANEAAEEARRQAEIARVEAERANTSKSEFLARMSHEIRTPLNAILGYTDLLLEDHRDGSDLSRKLELIQASGAALLTIVNDVLDFSKIEAGQIEIDATTFSPQTIIDNVASMLARFAEQKGNTLARQIDPALPTFLVGDDNRLRQIVLNLTNNAIKFTTFGRIVVGIDVESRGAEDVALRFFVSDTGIGIATEQQTRLFQRFSQVDGSITRRFGGTGLGLAICKQLVELMGGSIGVDSREGEGSTFWIRLTLPISTHQEPPCPTASAIEAPTGDTAWILLVEDVPLNQDLAKAVIERWGHRVDVASDGAEAIELVRRNRYDLVLMDVQMPVMDGVTATQTIRRADHANASVPILAMTANVLPQQIEALAAAGFDDHVGKPFKAPALKAAIERWARQSMPRRVALV